MKEQLQHVFLHANTVIYHIPKGSLMVLYGIHLILEIELLDGFGIFPYIVIPDLDMVGIKHHMSYYLMELDGI